MRPLASDLALASSQVKRFADRASTPLALSLDLAPLREDAGKAREIIHKLAEHTSQNFLQGKVAPRLSHATHAAMLGKGLIDAAAVKAPEITVVVSQAALRGSLSAAAGAVKGAVHTMTGTAHVALAVSSVALKVGLGLASAFLFAKVKEMTGASTVKMLLGYAGLKVGLALASATLRASVRTMAGIAMVPIRIGLGTLRAGLRTARSMVTSAVRQMAALAVVPLRVASAVSPYAAAAVGIGALASAGVAIAGSVKAASDLNETVSKVGFTFNHSADIVLKGADDMAARFGTPKKQFLDAAAGIGLIGKAAGQSDVAAAALGVNMGKLAADASSFYNIPLDIALEKMRAGLVGETEPLRQLGVLLNEDAVKAKGIAMGFALVSGHLSEANKVMARAALITEGMSTASGDLTRTGGELANRMRELWGRIQNLATSMGQFLLPAAKSLASALAEIAGGVGEAIERHKGTFESWGESIKKAADWLGIAYRNLSDIKAIAGLAMQDFGANALKAWKSIEVYLRDYASFLSETLSRAIEDGITRGLNSSKDQVMAAGGKIAAGASALANPGAALGRRVVAGAAGAVGRNPGTSATVAGDLLNPLGKLGREAGAIFGGAAVSTMMGTKGGMPALGATLGKSAAGLLTGPLRLGAAALTGKVVEAAGGPGYRAPIAPPTFKGPQWANSAEIGKKIADIKTMDTAARQVREWSGIAKDLVGRASGKLLGMAQGPLSYQQDKDKKRADAFDANTAFEAKGKNDKAAFEKMRPARNMAEAMKAFGALSMGLNVGIGGMAGGGIGAALPIANLAMSKVNSDAAKGLMNKPRFAGLAERGSKEDYSAVIKHFAAGGHKDADSKKLVKTADEQLKVTREMASDLRKGGYNAKGVMMFSI